MVQTLVRGLEGWPQPDKRAVALALVAQLDISGLAEVLACAHDRLREEVQRRASLDRERLAG